MLPARNKPIETIRDIRGKQINEIQVVEGKLFLYFTDGSHVFFLADKDVLIGFTHDRIDLIPGAGAPNRIMMAPKKILTLYDPLDPRSMLEDV
jgi:hypothetical protein